MTEENESQKEFERIKAKYFEKAKEENIHFSKEELIKKIAELLYEMDSANCHDHGFKDLSYIEEPYY